jgi:hypothetical protein
LLWCLPRPARVVACSIDRFVDLWRAERVAVVPRIGQWCNCRSVQRTLPTRDHILVITLFFKFFLEILENTHQWHCVFPAHWKQRHLIISSLCIYGHA